MPKSADEKRNRILDVAKRRFAHYGLAKTTMAEIAKDLAFSKALLYYYFPDKTSLYMAVIEDITEDMNSDIMKGINGTNSVIDAITVFLKKRLEYLKRYYYIIESTVLNRKDVSLGVDSLLIKSLDDQLGIVQYIFDRGVQSKELPDIDIEVHAKIFLNACMGMRFAVLNKINIHLVPGKEDFDSVLELQYKLADIYVKGLKV